jgi:hypothetical protein
MSILHQIELSPTLIERSGTNPSGFNHRPREEDKEEDGPSTSIWVNPSTSASNDQDQPIEQESHDYNSQVQEQPDYSTLPSKSTQELVVQPRIHHAISKDHLVDKIMGDISKGVQTRISCCFIL